MRYTLPDDHGLSLITYEQLVFKEGDSPALTDVQHEALGEGVAKGKSLLVVSPTSTGKTQIALWAIAQALERGENTVYLVTHRALARQKFDEFRTRLLADFLDNDPSSIVLATGDYVEDGDGLTSTEPLQASLLVATYEKYLALLSAGGIPTDMKRTVIICDEVQLIGDKNRGQNVEVLLTLLRNAGWKQFVGLSAVLEPKDAAGLAEWLGVALIFRTAREKNLRYECWTPNGIATVATATPEQLHEGLALPHGVKLGMRSALDHLLSLKPAPIPIIVFCMRKQDTYEFAEALVLEMEAKKGPQLSLDFDDLPETNANALLARSLNNRVATHNADLTEEERAIVESRLIEGKLDVVFATTTLAAGVNFPLGTALFADWSRWEQERGASFPIPASEFHNMAGRAGRMGFEHAEGLAIFFATTGAQVRQAKDYLDLSNTVRLEPRIDPNRFDQLTLQLIASGICSSPIQVHDLVSTTYSALLEQDKNPARYAKWATRIDESIESLVQSKLIWRTNAGRLIATPFGKAVGHSGLLPETGAFLLSYIASKVDVLTSLLPSPASGAAGISRLAFLIFSACYSSPEFRGGRVSEKTRYLPFPLTANPLADPSAFAADLAEPVWRADVMPINATKLTIDWIDGTGLRDLERSVQKLSAGMLTEMFRNLVWILQGLSAILSAVAASPSDMGIDDDLALKLAKLPRVIRRLSARVVEGLPDDLLWLREMVRSIPSLRLGRHDILALRAEGVSTPEQLSLGSKEADDARIRAFAKAKPTPQAKSNTVRDAARQWKSVQRKRGADAQVRRARHCERIDLLVSFYASKGKDFESAFEGILSFLAIPFKQLDDNTKTGAPDYVVEIEGCKPLVVELKSRDGDKLVDYNKAVEVIAAAEIHGYPGAFCVTLCHPGVDPSVPLVIAECGRLSVVETHDLGEALLRICEKSLSPEQLWHWLATPGQALASDLPWREFPAGDANQQK
jgi:helicase